MSGWNGGLESVVTWGRRYRLQLHEGRRRLTFRRLCLLLLCSYALAGAVLAWGLGPFSFGSRSLTQTALLLAPLVGAQALVSWRLADGSWLRDLAACPAMCVLGLVTMYAGLILGAQLTVILSLPVREPALVELGLVYAEILGVILLALGRLWPANRSGGTAGGATRRREG